MKKSSHFSRMTEMVTMAVDNAKPPEERAANEVIVENVISIDPVKCRMNPFHRRLASSVESKVLDELVEQLKGVGQILPARGWRLAKPDADGTEVILIFGARRRAAAERAQIPLKVEIVPEPTRQALIQQMHSENSSRKDYLPLEQGLEFKAFLESGEARSQEELASLLSVDRIRLTRCIQIADLPKDVLEIYTDPSHLTVMRGSALAGLIDKNADAKKRVIEAAREWKKTGKTGNPTGVLMEAAAEKRKPAKVEHDLLSDKKTRLGRLSASPNGAVTLQLGKGAPESLKNELFSLLKRHFPKLPT